MAVAAEIVSERRLERQDNQGKGGRATRLGLWVVAGLLGWFLAAVGVLPSGMYCTVLFSLKCDDVSGADDGWLRPPGI